MSDEHPDLYELAHRTLDAVITAPDAVIGNLPPITVVSSDLITEIPHPG